MDSILRRFLPAVAAVAVLAAPAQAPAAPRFLYMDAFKQAFHPLPGGACEAYYPKALGGQTPDQPINSYGGCAVVRFPAGSTIREIKYISTGNGGRTCALMQEFRYDEVNPLVDHYVNCYPSARSEQTLLATKRHADQDPKGLPLLHLRRGAARCGRGQPQRVPGLQDHLSQALTEAGGCGPRGSAPPGPQPARVRATRPRSRNRC